MFTFLNVLNEYHATGKFDDATYEALVRAYNKDAVEIRAGALRWARAWKRAAKANRKLYTAYLKAHDSATKSQMRRMRNAVMFRQQRSKEARHGN